jgi:hypothetical protein
MTATAIKERAIDFTAEEVRATLDGTMTKFYRPVEPQPERCGDGWLYRGQYFGNDDSMKSYLFHDVYGSKGTPYGSVYGNGSADRLYVREALWISDCKKYYARRLYSEDSTGLDVLAVDGSRIWLSGRYKPTGWEDTDRRYTHPEFPHMVVSWRNLGRSTRSGRWVSAFELGFADCDQSKRIEYLKGNTIIKSYKAQFHKHISPIHMPRWASRLTLELVDVDVEFQEQWAWSITFKRVTE